MNDILDDAHLRLSCAIAQLNTLSILLGDPGAIPSNSLLSENIYGVAMFLGDTHEKLMTIPFQKESCNA